MDLSPTSISEMQVLVGLNEDLTDKVLCRVRSIPSSPALLPVYSLLLLERYEAAIPLIESVLQQELDMECIDRLQGSKYYIQRMSVPCIIKALSFSRKKDILRTSLQDPICEVVKEAVRSIRENNPFNDDELVEIAIDLFKSKYTSVRVLSVDILALVGGSSFLLMDALKSNNWRLRLKVASCLQKFGPEDRKRVVGELVNDHVEEVRIELSKHLKTLDHLELLRDPCELVRSNYLGNVVGLIEDERVFKWVVEDKSWEVKKVLLNLKGELFKKITIPLIRHSTEGISWRTKHDILGLIEQKIDNEFVSKLMMGVLVRHLRDRVCEVRAKSQQVLVKIIKKYGWVDEYYYEIEAVAHCSNYLHRISVVPVAVEYDMRMGTDLSRVLKHDRVVNVRDCYYDYVKGHGIWLTYNEDSGSTNGEESQADAMSVCESHEHCDTGWNE